MSATRTVYSQKLKEALEDLRPAVRDIGTNIDALKKKRRDFAPQFMKTYALWKRETHRPFIAFVAAIDSSVPVNDREAYRVHASYRAARYLQGLVNNPEATKPKGYTPLAMLAVAIKSFLPLCGSQKDQKDALLIILAATKWRESDQRRLIAKIRRAKAVGLPKVPRLVEAVKATRAVVVAFEKEQRTGTHG